MADFVRSQPVLKITTPVLRDQKNASCAQGQGRVGAHRSHEGLTIELIDYICTLCWSTKKLGGFQILQSTWSWQGCAGDGAVPGWRLVIDIEFEMTNIVTNDKREYFQLTFQTEVFPGGP